MRKLPWLWLWLCLTGGSGCELIWSPYITSGCIPGQGDDACTLPGSDGGPTDAAPGDAVADAAPCPAPAAWTDLSSPTYGMLNGVTGMSAPPGVGASFVWIGSPTFRGILTYGSTTFGTLTGQATTATGRMVYAPASKSVLEVSGTQATDRLDMTTITPGSAALMGTETIIGLSNGPSSDTTAYLCGNKGTLLSWNDAMLMWQAAGSIAGSLVDFAVATKSAGGARVIWGIRSNFLYVLAAGLGPFSTTLSGVSGLKAVWADATASGWAAGAAGVILNCGPPGNLTLAPEPSGVTANLWDIAGTGDSADLWAVGDQGTIVHRSSICSQWTPEPSGTTASLRALWVDDIGHRVWVVGDNGTVLYRGF